MRPNDHFVNAICLQSLKEQTRQQTCVHGDVQIARRVWSAAHGNIDRPKSMQAKTNAAEANVLEATSGFTGSAVKAKFRRSTTNTNQHVAVVSSTESEQQKRKSIQQRSILSPSYRRFGRETATHAFVQCFSLLSHQVFLHVFIKFVFRMFLFFFRGTCKYPKSTNIQHVHKCSAADPPNVPDTPMYWPRGRGRGGQGFVSFLMCSETGASRLSYTLEEIVWCFLLYQTPRGPFGSLLKLLKRFPNQTFDQKKPRKSLHGSRIH